MELHYIQAARDDAAHGRTWPLPGTLRFGHRPELASRLLAGLVPPEASRAEFVRRVGLLNSLLCLALIAAVFGQARVSGASERAALIAASSVAAFPWLGFHVHSLWPEIFHAAVFASALLAALLYLRTGRIWPLALSGLATGVALLAKGSLTLFVPLFAVLFRDGGVATRKRARTRHSRAARRLGSGGLPRRSGAGDRPPARSQPERRARRTPRGQHMVEPRTRCDVAGRRRRCGCARKRRPLAARGRPDRALRRGGAPRSRPRKRRPSAHARLRRRARRHCRRRRTARQAVGSLDRRAGLLPQRQASFDQALGPRARWGAKPPAWLAAWQSPARWAWRLLVPLGLLGLLWGARDSPQRLLLALFAVGFLLAGAGVPVKLRFLLPAVPVLALGVGFLADRLAPRPASAAPAN